jgi:hypothetical protein
MTHFERLERFVRSWEFSLAREFLEYDRLLRAKSRRPPTEWGQSGAEPYWKEIPRWLTERQGDWPGSVSPEFLDTVLWGQTCLFYAIRLQDDLLDGHLSRSSIALAPLLFLTEAHRTFSSVFDRNAGFWEHYRKALETTVGGIARVAHMQRDSSARADELLQAYGCVDAIFSVGSSAICDRMGRAGMIPRVDGFVCEMGKVLLTLDDVEDIEEDLADGRLTYPARVLLMREIESGADIRPLARIWRTHALAGGFDAIKEVLLGCLRRANDSIAPLKLQPVTDLIETTNVAVNSLGEAA